MKAKSIHNLPTADRIAEENSVLIARNGGFFRMLMKNFRNYIAYSTGAAVLGLPIPTEANAGMSPVVDETGGYTLKHVDSVDLLWENPAPNTGFPAQTIACNTSGCKMLVVVLKHSDVNTPETVPFANDGTEACLYVSHFKTSATIVIQEYRLVTSADTGITFGDGRCTTANSGLSISDSYAVPLAIYGIA